MRFCSVAAINLEERKGVECIPKPYIYSKTLEVIRNDVKCILRAPINKKQSYTPCWDEKAKIEQPYLCPICLNNTGNYLLRDYNEILETCFGVSLSDNQSMKRICHRCEKLIIAMVEFRDMIRGVFKLNINEECKKDTCMGDFKNIMIPRANIWKCPEESTKEEDSNHVTKEKSKENKLYKISKPLAQNNFVDSQNSKYKYKKKIKNTEDFQEKVAMKNKISESQRQVDQNMRPISAVVVRPKNQHRRSQIREDMTNDAVKKTRVTCTFCKQKYLITTANQKSVMGYICVRCKNCRRPTARKVACTHCNENIPSTEMRPHLEKHAREKLTTRCRLRSCSAKKTEARLERFKK